MPTTNNGKTNDRVAHQPIWVPEEDVTLEKIADVFRSGGVPSSPLGDSSLKIDTGELAVGIQLVGGMAVKYSAAFPIENAPSVRKLALANELNRRMVFTRFSIHGDDGEILLAEYFISYTGGFATPTLFHGLWHFVQSTSAAISELHVGASNS